MDKIKEDTAKIEEAEKKLIKVKYRVKELENLKTLAEQVKQQKLDKKRKNITKIAEIQKEIESKTQLN